jgi:hypothetical protein
VNTPYPYSAYSAFTVDSSTPTLRLKKKTPDTTNMDQRNTFYIKVNFEFLKISLLFFSLAINGITFVAFSCYKI